MLARLFTARRRQEAAERTFQLLTRTWRNPALFGDGRLSDDPDGRFEACALYAAVLFTRLAGRGAQAEELGQAVFDIQFKAFDQALRDLGVGDVHVGKRIRVMAESFYGRLAAYRPPLEAGDQAALAEALARNLFQRDPVEDGFEHEAASAAASWLATLREVDDALLLEGRTRAA
jgi:cytochrome b pre-mRNA-processing protein 3